MSLNLNPFITIASAIGVLVGIFQDSMTMVVGFGILMFGAIWSSFN